ncbi:MAG: hypothetical protein IKR51_05635, partial [Oscillospiraceae bacterium]|nr:hypothetical protein [Oscillospiraceae bacterium]
DMADPDYPVLQFTADISSGSSGGPLITCHGEAAGVVMAYYPSGNGLYLAVPINYATGASFFSSPMTPAEIADLEAEKRAKATISVEQTELTLKVGETKSVLVTYDCTSTVSISCEPADLGVVMLRWGDFESKFSVPLYITGDGAGETDVRIFYTKGYGNEEAEATIHVTVVEE